MSKSEAPERIYLSIDEVTLGFGISTTDDEIIEYIRSDIHKDALEAIELMIIDRDAFHDKNVELEKKLNIAATGLEDMRTSVHCYVKKFGFSDFTINLTQTINKAINKQREIRMKCEKIPIKHKPNCKCYLCKSELYINLNAHDINVTSKQQSTSDEIREAFSKYKNWDMGDFDERSQIYKDFSSIYTTAQQKAQAEIEELINEYKEIDNINTELRIELQKAKQQIKDREYKEKSYVATPHGKPDSIGE